jgi:hypothetical protein
MVEQKNPERYKTLLESAKRQVADRYSLYRQLAEPPSAQTQTAAPTAPAEKVQI